eukprot:3192195-Rhodomonas_salina.1
MTRKKKERNSAEAGDNTLEKQTIRWLTDNPQEENGTFEAPNKTIKREEGKRGWVCGNLAGGDAHFVEEDEGVDEPGVPPQLRLLPHRPH